MQALPSTLTLVVVDDNAHVLRAVSRFLRSYGHAVHAFESAEAYLARSCQADCAVIDIELPGISGLELEARMRQDGRGIPVVFITAHDELDTLTAVQQTHRPLLKKPLDQNGLLDAIARAIGDQG
jgi:FixJ family two-component response regulator